MCGLRVHFGLCGGEVWGLGVLGFALIQTFKQLVVKTTDAGLPCF